jgi:tetratricopeptide (TPR) repeat protein
MADNWYIVLELAFDPSPEHDESVIAKQIEEKRKFWSRGFNDPNMEPEYHRYLDKVADGTIARDMIGPNNKRKQLIKEACEIVYGPVDETLRLTGLNGEITGDEFQRIANEHHTDIDVVLRRAFNLGIEIGKAKQEDYLAVYEKYYKKKPDNAAAFELISPYLKSFSVHNLYDFLTDDTSTWEIENSSSDVLRKKAEDKRKKEFHSNDTRSSFGQRLCAHCELAFKDERSKAVYDDYLMYTRTKALLDKVKRQYNISSRLSEGASDKFVTDLTELLKDRELATTVLVSFCQIERIPYNLQKSSPPPTPTPSPMPTPSPTTTPSTPPYKRILPYAILFLTLFILTLFLVNFPHNDGRYSEAEVSHEKAGEIEEKGLEPEDPDTVESLNDLGTAASLTNRAHDLDDQGKYSEAEQLHKKAGEIEEKGLDPEDLGTAASLTNRAHDLDDQGMYSDAEQLHKRALEITEKVLGPEHPNTALSLNDLANNLDRQGRYSEAEQLHKRALEIAEETLDPQDPDIATLLNSLANNLDRQSRYSETERLYKRALKIREKVLGPEHPDTALSLNNLAVCITNRGSRYAEAEQLHKRALKITEKVLGPEHLDTVRTLNSLANNLYIQRRYAEAEPLYKRAVETTAKMLGPEHPNTVIALNNLVDSVRRQGRYAEAEEIFERYQK